MLDLYSQFTKLCTQFFILEAISVWMQKKRFRLRLNLASWSGYVLGNYPVPTQFVWHWIQLHFPDGVLLLQGRTDGGHGQEDICLNLVGMPGSILVHRMEKTK